MFERSSALNKLSLWDKAAMIFMSNSAKVFCSKLQNSSFLNLSILVHYFFSNNSARLKKFRKDNVFPGNQREFLR